MSADEFIEQYGRMEMLKIMKEKDPQFDVQKANRMTQGGSASRAANALGVGDMKDMMRQTMSNIKTYGGESPKSGGRRDQTTSF